MISAHTSPLATLGGKEAGGMNVYIRELSRELGRRGITVDIFTRTQDADAATVVPFDRNVRVINLRAGPPVPYDKNWLLDHMPEFVNHVRCFADSHDGCYDVIHSHYWLSGVAALELRKLWRAPVVHMFHTLGAMKNRVARSSEEQETLKRMQIERELAAAADMLVAATPRDRAEVVWHCGADASDVRVIPCGVDLQRFRPRDMEEARTTLDLPLDAKIVVLVGRIEPLKGIDALTRAVALLEQRHPQWQGKLLALVVGGAGEDTPEQWNSEQRRLDQLRSDLGVEAAVRFVGARSQDDLALFYNAADVVTMPSHYESFGMAALEGLASGRPVVATSAGGPAFIVDDGISGLLTPPDDAETLACNLEAVLSDDALAAQMAVEARKRAQRFGWNTVANDVLCAYRDARQAMAVEALPVRAAC